MLRLEYLLFKYGCCIQTAADCIQSIDYEKLPESQAPRIIRDHKMEVIFPNGAKIKYQQAENVAKSKNDAQGQEFTLIGIDKTLSI